jgi:hypothetical protein
MEQSNEKKEITGVWAFANADELEGFFVKKGIQEEKLGRVLTENEVHELLRSMKDDGDIAGFEIEKNKGDVRAVLTEHFNCKIIKAKKSEDEENV